MRFFSGDAMKWQNYFLINLNSHDLDACKHTTAWKQRYSIPYHRCFGLGGTLSPGCIPFYPLSSTSLTRVSRFSKLIIVSHGNEIWVNSWTPPQLAERLRAWGLREVGLVAFKACETGLGSYLDELAERLNERGIGFGWLVGYRGAIILAGSSFVEAHEIVGEQDVFWRDLGLKPSDETRVRVVRGNIAAPVPSSSRYW
jgi:hypothetical protein